MPVIDTKATGQNMKTMMKNKKMTITDIQVIFGFNTPQAIFKWFRGDAMPTIDNMIIFADIFGVKIDDIIVVKKAA